MEPTKEQIQWFWEQCGLTLYRNQWWFGKWGEEKHYYGIEPPLINLTNLFKYAVPKLDEPKIFLREHKHIRDKYYCKITIDCEPWEIDAWGDTYALALFWAIFKAFGGKE